MQYLNWMEHLRKQFRVVHQHEQENREKQVAELGYEVFSHSSDAHLFLSLHNYLDRNKSSLMSLKKWKEVLNSIGDYVTQTNTRHNL